MGGPPPLGYRRRILLQGCGDSVGGDVHEHFDRGLTRTALDELIQKLPGAIVATTVHLARLAPRDSRIGSDIIDLISKATETTTLKQQLVEQELIIARQAHPTIAERDDLEYFVEVLAAVPELRRKLATADSPVGHAIVEAAATWQRAGMAAAIPTPNLLTMTELTLPPASRPQVTDDSFHDGMRWVTKPVAAGDRAADSRYWWVMAAVRRNCR